MEIPLKLILLQETEDRSTKNYSLLTTLFVAPLLFLLIPSQNLITVILNFFLKRNVSGPTFQNAFFCAGRVLAEMLVHIILSLIDVELFFFDTFVFRSRQRHVNDFFVEKAFAFLHVCELLKYMGN